MSSGARLVLALEGRREWCTGYECSILIIFRGTKARGDRSLRIFFEKRILAFSYTCYFSRFGMIGSIFWMGANLSVESRIDLCQDMILNRNVGPRTLEALQ
jgi:hypothetical protein